MFKNLTYIFQKTADSEDQYSNGIEKCLKKQKKSFKFED
jgi:hypothetical protein